MFRSKITKISNLNFKLDSSLGAKSTTPEKTQTQQYDSINFASLKSETKHALI